MHILVRLSCTKSFCGVQNQSFSFLFLCFVLFLVTANVQLVGNYIHKMIIKFVFCVVSLLWTSRYVLIDYTRLTHFLCCSLFVMLCWIKSAISANVLEICLSIALHRILVNFLVAMVLLITNTHVAFSIREF